MCYMQLEETPVRLKPRPEHQLPSIYQKSFYEVIRAFPVDSSRLLFLKYAAVAWYCLRTPDLPTTPIAFKNQQYSISYHQWYSLSSTLVSIRR